MAVRVDVGGGAERADDGDAGGSSDPGGAVTVVPPPSGPASSDVPAVVPEGYSAVVIEVVWPRTKTWA